MSAYPSPPFPSAATAFQDLCALYDPLLGAGGAALPESARIDLRAFARLYDLALEEAGEAEVWREVRGRLAQDVAAPLQTPGEWGYEEARQAA